MPIIILSDGKTIDVSENELSKYAEDPKYFDAKIAIGKVDKDNNIVKRGTRDLNSWGSMPLGDDTVFIGKDEYDKRGKKAADNTDWVDTIRAGNRAFLRGATFGGSDRVSDWANKNVSDWFPSKEELAQSQKDFPKLSTGMEIAGGVAPALISGGATAAGAGIGKAAAARLGTQATKIGWGQKIASGLPGVVDRYASGIAAGRTGLGRMASVGARAAEGALTGAAMGADYAFLNNKDTLQEMRDAAAVGIILGGGLSAAGNVIGAGYNKIKDTIEHNKYIDELIKDSGTEGWLSPTTVKVDTHGGNIESRIDPLTGKGIMPKPYVDEPGILSKIAGKVTGIDPKVISEFTRGARGRWTREQIPQAEEFLNKDAPKVLSELEAHSRDAADDALKNIREFKPDRVYDVIDESIPEKTGRIVNGVLSDIRSKIDDMMESGVGEYGQQNKLSAIRSRINTALGSADYIPTNSNSPRIFKTNLFNELDNLKRDIGRMEDSIYRAIPELSDRGAGNALSTSWKTANELREHYGLIRDLLENGTLWGKAADAQKNINKAVTRYMDFNRANIKARLYRRGVLPDAAREADTINFDRYFDTDPGGFDTFIKNINTPGGELDTKYYVGRIINRKNTLAAIRDNYKLDADEIAKIDEAIEAIDSKLELITSAREFTDILQKNSEIRSKSASSGFSNTLPKLVMGGAAGSLFGNPLLGAAAALTTDTIKLARNPALWVDTLSLGGVAGQIAEDIVYNIGSKSSKFVTGKQGPVIKAVVMAAEKDREGSLARKNALKSFIKDPQGTIERAQAQAQDVDVTRPLKALASVAPKPKTQSMIDQLSGKDADIDQRQFEIFEPMAKIVQNPAIVVDLMNKGQLRSEHVDLLKNAYPKAYSAMVDQYKLWLAQRLENKQKIDPSLEKQLSIFFGESLTGKTDPRLSAMIQNGYKSQDTEKEIKSLSSAKAKNISNSISQTKTEQIEQR